MNPDDREWSFSRPGKDRDTFLKAVENWFGTQWLSQLDGSHPLQRLWRRRDWLSSAELFTIGWALTNQQPMCESDWFIKAAREIKKAPTSGDLFELIAAAMLNNETHEAHLSTYGHPGSDVRVLLPSGTVVNVSCKSLNPSDQELAFRKGANELVQTVVSKAESIQASPQILAVTDTFGIPGTLLREQVTRNICHPLMDTVFTAGTWTVHVGLLPPSEPNLVVSTYVTPSYHIIVASPLNSGEQRRFENLFRKATNNLKKHHPSVSRMSINMIMIKLPESVSFGTAAYWLDGQFTSAYSSITAVLLYRTSLRRDNEGVFVSHEVFLRHNPHAKVSWDTISGGLDSLRLVVPVGKHSTGDPVTSVLLGNTTIAEGPMYLYRRGLIHYEIELPPSKGTTLSFPWQPHPTVEVRLVFRDPLTGAMDKVGRDPRYLLAPALEML